MPENKYSKDLKKLISKWGDKNRSNFEYTIHQIKTRNTSDEIGIPGASKVARSPLNKFKIVYQPDVFYKLLNKDVLVFEIVDSQEGLNSKTIADIVRCIFHGSITDIIFVAKNKKIIKNILKIATVILLNFMDYLNLIDIEKKKKETPIQVHGIVISKSNSKSETKTFNILDLEMKRIINS